MKRNVLLGMALIALLAVFGISCDNDSNEIGADIVGGENFEFGEKEFGSVNAYNLRTGAVETSNTAVQQLGIYNDPVFGKTTAHMILQPVLSVQPTTIDYDRAPVVDSVVLLMPYFSHITTASGDLVTKHEYELDSVYNPDSKIDLKVYESSYYLRTLDPETGETQKYYSDQLPAFEAARVGSPLNNAAEVGENTAFGFSKKGTIETNDEGTKTQIAPRARIHLDKDFFTNKLFAPSAEANLLNNNVFSNYFRGLHFTVSQSAGEAGVMALLNASASSIVVYYHQNTSDTDTTPVTKTLTLKLSGNRVNFLQHERTPLYSNFLAGTSDPVNGDEKLYVKGGEGSLAVIELFKNPGELEELRSHFGQWLLNDASLTFYVDDITMGQGDPKADEPNRVYLYDLNNKKVLIDYTTDQTSSSTSVKFDKYVHGGIIVKKDGRGAYYKVRLTNHIRNLIANDTVTNVRLGLVVTEDINTTSNKGLKTTQPIGQSGTFAPFNVKEIPTMSIVNPFGTVLWGSSPAVPDDKRLKLTLYYTKPN